MALNFIGYGEALVLNDKCKKVINYSVETILKIYEGEIFGDIFVEVNYDNSFLGKGRVSTVENNQAEYIGSDDKKNYNWSFFVDEEGNLFGVGFITGMKGECNFATNELIMNISAPAPALNKSLISKLKVKSAGEFGNFLKSHPGYSKKVSDFKKKVKK